MDEISDRYQRLSAAFADKIQCVAPDGWDAPTPCTDWNVRELVAHVVYMSEVHLNIVGRPLRPGPSVDDDPLGAYTNVSGQIADDLADPARAAAPFDSRFGQWTFAEAIDRAICYDLAIHGWDLARATGQDERIDPAEIPKLWDAIKAVGEEAIRNPSVTAPAIDPSPGADEQTRLLAFLGRQA